MQRIRAAIFLLAAMIGLVAWGGSHAAPPACTMVAGLPAARQEGPSEREPRRVLPIGGYTLAMVWMPQRCRKDGQADCALYTASLRGGSGRRDGLTLHGLWPDGTGKEWPQWCAPAPPLAKRTIAAHVCATPSPQLLQHEWAKHGTCMAGYTPDRYFALSNRLFADLRAPRLRALSYRRQTAAGVARAFAVVNPGMTADMVRLNLDKEGWLEEIWVCLDTRFDARRCPLTQGGAHGDERVLIWRGGGGGGESRPRRYRPVNARSSRSRDGAGRDVGG